MKTHCNQKTCEFQVEKSRKIVAHFNGEKTAKNQTAHHSPIRPLSAELRHQIPDGKPAKKLVS